MNQMNDKFISLLMANQRRIHSFIVHFVPNRSDSDDIFQETVSLMWRKFDEFEEGTNFAAWGVQIARYMVLKLSSRNRNPLVRFDSDIVRLISQFLAEHPNEADDRFELLRGCLRELPEKQRSLLAMRYDQDLAVKKISLQIGKSFHAVYKALGRIHIALLQCIKQKMAERSA